MKATAALPPALLLAVLLVLPATAYDESEAPAVDPRIERVWHEPAVPAPGQQWQGWIAFVPGHDVTEVLYQVCNVGVACIAPPTPAVRLNDTTWTYDTADYTDPQGNPVPWGDDTLDGGRDWRVGTQFFLRTADNDTLQAVPHGENLSSPACEGRYRECSETHYFAWDMPAGPVGAGRDAPAPLLAPALLLVALALRRRHDRPATRRP